MSRDEALQYLRLKGIDDKTAAQIYELVGGRMIDIQLVAKRLIRGNQTLQGRHSML